MAYLKRIKRSTKKSGTKFYYYSLIKSVNWSKDKLISLETTDYKDALEKHEEVEDKEVAIKRGVQYSFSWENESNRGRARIVKHSVKDLVDKWLRIKSTNVRNETLKVRMLMVVSILI
jgi:hypothetical protein